MHIISNNLIIFFFCITGPSLPYGLQDSAMAESPDGRGVLLFGGYSPTKEEIRYRFTLLNEGFHFFIFKGRVERRKG